MHLSQRQHLDLGYVKDSVSTKLEVGFMVGREDKEGGALIDGKVLGFGPKFDDIEGVLLPDGSKLWLQLGCDDGGKLSEGYCGFDR